MGMTSHSGFSFRLLGPGARVARPFHAQRTGKPFKPREEGTSEPENGKTRITDCKRHALRFPALRQAATGCAGQEAGIKPDSAKRALRAMRGFTVHEKGAGEAIPQAGENDVQWRFHIEEMLYDGLLLK